MRLGTRELSETGAWTVEFDASRLVFGAGALERLGELASGLGCRRVLLVTDRGLRAAGHLDRALASLGSASVESAVYDAVGENPTTHHVDGAVAAAGDRGVDGIVGLGGGSPMDCAKAANFLLTQGGRLQDYRGSGRATRPMLPSIGVPTTAGSGSDAQSYALVSEEGSGRKMACGDRRAKFRVVILDPELTATVPRGAAAVAGIDAVSHAVESYVCTRRNPVSQMLAREAWRLLESSLERSLLAGARDEDAEIRGRMLLGAHLAGASIEQSMLGAAHACANPLTARFGLTHGIAVALMLPHVMAYNEPAAGELYEELRRVAGGPAPTLRHRVVELRAAAGLPARLRDCGVERGVLDELAEEASSQWTAEFNPRPVTGAGLLELYEAAY